MRPGVGPASVLGAILMMLASGAAGLEAQERNDSRDVMAPEGMEFVASTRGRTYYYVECSGWRSLAPSNLRWFGTREQAVRAGLRPSRQSGCAGPGAERGAGAIGIPDSAALPELPDVRIAGSCVVERVVDGDTFLCGDERVRLLLVDAPELDQAPFGALAQAALVRLIPAGSRVALELDVRERDRYGRVLAYAYRPDGRMVNEALLEEGYAVVSVYPPDVKYADRFRSVQRRARAASRGLWDGSAFDCLPADHRAGRCP